MDATSYPLVPLPPEHGPLIPVSFALADLDSPHHTDPNLRALLTLLWRCFCKLSVLFFFAVIRSRERRLQITELRLQANYWQAQHQRAVQREAHLKQEVLSLQAQIRELKRRLYGRKSETASANKPDAKATPNHGAKRPRGQQRGSKGHGRRHHDHLPPEHEYCTLPLDQRCCPCCGEPFVEIPGTADGDIFEIDVKAHRRRYHRQRYRRTCTCPNQPAVITAPPPDKVIPKGTIGVSLWVLILLRKFLFYQPLYRVVAELRGHALSLPTGTIIGGMQKLVPLFEPLYKLLSEFNRTEEQWNADETRWLMFFKHPGKAGFAWNLWVFAGQQSIVFVLDPTRSRKVPEDHFGPAAEGFLNVDRYSSYKAMAQVKAGKIILSFCWAHVRRDFMEVLTGWSDLTDWAWSWIEEIATLYQHNDQRLALPNDAPTYAEADRRVREQVEHLRQRRDSELCQPDLRTPQRKVLISLQNHWDGLIVFVDHPEVPMDNNRGERCERGPVIARKNFYGSGALWSGRLAAMLFSFFQTLQLWHMDPGKWLTAYLSACAKAAGKPPPDLHFYLPWNMTPQQRDDLCVATRKPPDVIPPNAHANTSTNAQP